MGTELKATVCISGRGSNLKGLLDGEKNYGGYTIANVLSDKPDATGLQYARDANIPIHTLYRTDFSTFSEFKTALFQKLDALPADLICLAGFMQLVPEWFIKRWFGKLINIHPSLLPKFPGLHTHERALEAGETVHGCTVHFVDEGVDTGPIIAQVQCPVLPDDSADTLAARVLKLEHKIYPWVMSCLARKLISIDHGKVSYDPIAKQEAIQKDFYI